MSQTLQARPLSADAFAPFGQVVAASDSQTPLVINDGKARRYHHCAPIRLQQDGIKAGISLFEAEPYFQPGESLKLALLERHPKASQAFIPMSAKPYLILVADSVEQPQIEHLHLFLAHSNQGFSLNPGVWHHPLLVLQSQSFAVVDCVDCEDNCELVHFHPAQDLLLQWD